jgi:hypothetical protein
MQAGIKVESAAMLLEEKINLQPQDPELHLSKGKLFQV